jgi:hypothetical protein
MFRQFIWSSSGEFKIALVKHLYSSDDEWKSVHHGVNIHFKAFFATLNIPLNSMLLCCICIFIVAKLINMKDITLYRGKTFLLLLRYIYACIFPKNSSHKSSEFNENF